MTSTNATRLVYNDPGWLDTVAAWVLALLWILPLAYAVWTAFHPSEYSTRFDLPKADQLLLVSAKETR